MSWLLKEAVIIPPDYEEVLDAVDRHVQDPVTMSSEEYKDLLNLITVLIQEGVPSEAIKNILGASPMETIQDIGDMKAKLWTLATVEYGIPRKYLIEKMQTFETTK
jgi:hypothetical protein